MICLENFVQTIEEGEIVKEPLNVAYGGGIHYLAESQKEIFDIFSFSFVGIKEGSLKIDDLTVTNDVSTLGRVIVYRIGVEGFATLSAVFILPQGFKEAYKRRKEIATSIAALREMPGETFEDKQAKFLALYGVLEKEGASYVLCDYSLKVNNQHKEEIEPLFSDIKLTTLILTYVPKTKAKAVVVKPVLEEDLDLGNFLKKDASSFLFEGIFGLIFSFSLYGSICLLAGGEAGLGGCLIFVSIACLIMGIVILSFIQERVIKLLSNKNSYTKVQFMTAFVQLLACGIGLLVAFLCAYNDVILPNNSVMGVATIACVIGDILLIFLSFFLSVPHKIWNLVRKLFKKK